MDFNGMSVDGALLLPLPEQPSLTTSSFSTGFRSSWHLSGHSHVVVNAYESDHTCQAVAMGGAATATILNFW